MFPMRLPAIPEGDPNFSPHHASKCVVRLLAGTGELRYATGIMPFDSEK
mgnify:CR=1 FL=1